MNLLAREYLNAGLIPLTASIMFIIGYTLFDSYRTNGNEWWVQPGVKSAFALWWIFFADLMRATMAWSFLNAMNDGKDLSGVSYAATILYLIAATIAALGTFVLIYALSPSSWGHKGWVASAVLTFICVLILGLVF